MSKTVEWATPQKLFNALNAEFRFTLDPCSTHQNAKCAKHYTLAEDGLTKDWGTERVFMNPPYGRSQRRCGRRCRKIRCVDRGYHT